MKSVLVIFLTLVTSQSFAMNMACQERNEHKLESAAGEGYKCDSESHRGTSIFTCKAEGKDIKKLKVVFEGVAACGCAEIVSVENVAE